MNLVKLNYHLPAGHDTIFHANVRMEHIGYIKNGILDVVCDSPRESVAIKQLESIDILIIATALYRSAL